MLDSLVHGARLVMVALALQQTQDPPGMGACEEEEFLQLQMDVVKHCAVEQPQCDERMACQAAIKRQGQLHLCFSAKQALSRRCFNGGTPKQKREVEAVGQAERHCDDMVLSEICLKSDEDRRNAPRRPEPAPPPITLDPPAAIVILEPPGDCTKSLYRELNSAVGEHCKKYPMSCEKDDLDCPTLELFIGRFEACIRVRRLLMDTCFRGGDADHKRAVDQAIGGQSKCLIKYAQKCGSDPRCRH